VSANVFVNELGQSDVLAVEHTAPREARVIEMPDPEPRLGQVRVHMMVGGICGSDLHRYRADTKPNMDRVLGHEPCGVAARAIAVSHTP